MDDSNKSVVLAVEPKSKSILFYAEEDGRITQDVRTYKAQDFSDEFFRIFESTLQELGRKHTPAPAADTTIVLPDNVVFTDALFFPAMNNSAMKNSVQTALNSAYINRKDLIIKSFVAMQNKQTTTCCIAGVKNEIVENFRLACTEGKMLAQNYTYAANTTVTALNMLNPKLRASTFLFMDIKSDSTRFVYVFKGRALASQALPFGYSIFETGKVAAEDMIIDHPVAALAVINAKEKAKAKALTMMGNDAQTDNPDEESEESFANVDSLIVQRADVSAKTTYKKVARKLPKYMLRDEPTEPEAITYENFRLFVKWALSFLGGNEKLNSIAKPEAVYVNMPAEYKFLYDMVNAEEEENGIKFLSAELEKQKPEISRNLELYGGLFARKMNTEYNF